MQGRDVEEDSEEDSRDEALRNFFMASQAAIEAADWEERNPLQQQEDGQSGTRGTWRQRRRRAGGGGGGGSPTEAEV